MFKTRSMAVASGRAAKRRTVLIMLVFALLAVLLLSSCSSIGSILNPSTKPTTETIEPGVSVPPEPETLQIAVALDTSGSTADSFAEGVRDALAAKAAGFIPEKPESKKDGVNAVSGLRIVVYLINTMNANIYGEGSNVIGEIPGIPALPPYPEIPKEGITNDYLDAETAWQNQNAAWEKAYDASLERAKEVSKRILGMSLKANAQGNASGIYNAICAVINATTSGKINVGVFSDLMENGTDRGAPPNEKSGSVVFCVPAPDGDVVAANERMEALSRTMEAWGFSPAKTYNPDLLPEAVNVLFGK